MIAILLDGSGPVNQQLYRAMRTAILTAQLKPGEALAPTRVLAKELSVSRNTILFAYDQLVAEGYAVTRQGAGTFVVDKVPIDGFASRKREPLRVPAKEPALGHLNLPDLEIPQSQVNRALRFNFKYGEPAFADLPLETWARLVGRRARTFTERQLSYPSPGGAIELRQALSAYLFSARGVICQAEQVIILQGTQQGIDLTARLMVKKGSKVVVEEPQYRGLVASMKFAGADLHYVPVDHEGLIVDQLEKIGNSRLVCCTPSHQFPSGGVLPLTRRLKLLAWAEKNDAMVLEDDYDGEFRYESRPIPSLQSLDTEGRVLYLGTASKILFPSLRLGWLVVPPSWVSSFQAVKSISDRGCSMLEQLALADFISEGHLARHIHRIRKRHARRRAVLLAEVENQLGHRAVSVGTQAGIHVLLRVLTLPGSLTEQMLQECRDVDVGVYSSQPYYQNPPDNIELIMGYASLDENAIPEAVKRIALVINKLEKANLNNG